MTPEQPAADAPIEERQAFEQSVDVFSGEHDDYVPVGSTITVAQRRSVIALSAVGIVLPAQVRKARAR